MHACAAGSSVWALDLGRELHGEHCPGIDVTDAHVKRFDTRNSIARRAAVIVVALVDIDDGRRGQHGEQRQQQPWAILARPAAERTAAFDTSRFTAELDEFERFVDVGATASAADGVGAAICRLAKRRPSS